MNSGIQRAFDAAAGSVVEAFRHANPAPEEEVTPPLLVEALGQCFEICANPGTAGALTPEEITEIGTQALDCIYDLSLWAYQLGLAEAQPAIEDPALEFAQWIAQQGGEIRLLEPVVNALARRANALHTPDALTPLYVLAHDIIDHAAPQARDDSPASAPDAPWRILHFNCAIIATRIQHPELMDAAYDLLERNLPHDCAAFFAEGMREAEKQVYEPHVRAMMQQRLAKWTARH